jgi:hypothetical protein
VLLCAFQRITNARHGIEPTAHSITTEEQQQHTSQLASQSDNKQTHQLASPPAVGL